MTQQQPGPSGWQLPPDHPNRDRYADRKWYARPGWIITWLIGGITVLFFVAVAIIAANSPTVQQPDATPAIQEPAAPAAPSAATPTTQPPAAGTARVVLNLTGSGIKRTQRFTVDDSWEIRWANQAAAGYFGIYVNDADGVPVGVAANTTDQGRDTWPGMKAGTYYLEINATGRWGVQVVDTP
jgi:hypothetical protein